MLARRDILYPVIITFALLLALEALSRLAFTIYSDAAPAASSYDWWVPSKELGWERRPNFSGFDECGAYRSFAADGLVAKDAEQLKAVDRKARRIVFLGDSNTYGYCLSTDMTFVEVSKRLLPNADVFNLAVPGYTSAQGYRALLKYGEEINPTDVFISFNFNDRRAVAGAGGVDSDETFRRLGGTGTAQFLERLYLFRIVRGVGKRLGIVRTAPASALLVDAETITPRVDLQSYRDNLIKMVEWARQHGSTPYFLLLGDNPSYAARIRAALSRMNAKDYAAAIKEFTFEATYAKSAYDAIARRNLSAIYKEMGRLGDAKDVLQMRLPQSAHGAAPVSLDTDYQEIMRKVAEERGVQLIDAKSRLDTMPHVFFDYCHFDGEGHAAVAEAIKESLMGGRRLPLQGAQDTSAGIRER
jgi:lysophospholipase L1-like esterase